MVADEGTLKPHEIRVLNLYREHRHPVEVFRKYVPGKKVPCEGHYEYCVDGLPYISEGAYKLLKMHILQENF
jgi:hypothetical protein